MSLVRVVRREGEMVRCLVNLIGVDIRGWCDRGIDHLPHRLRRLLEPNPHVELRSCHAQKALGMPSRFAMDDVHVSSADSYVRVDAVVDAMEWTDSILDTEWMSSELSSFGDVVALTVIDHGAKHIRKINGNGGL